MNPISRLLHPQSVAVVGASSDPDKLTGRPIAYLQKHGFAGRIYPINPRAPQIAGLTCYPDAKSLPSPPDVGLVLLGAEQAIDAVRQLAEAGAKTAIVLASGFGEAGAEGQRRQAALKAAAGRMRVLGPNTIGLVNLTDRITLSVSGALEIDDLVPGRIAVVSQSGGILGSLLSRAAGRGIGLSRLIATGNEVDLEVADCLDHLVEDDATSVIALYLEGLRNVARFRAAAERAAAAGKHIVAFKVGRSEAGMRSAISHTGALAGADRMYDALFRQAGVIRAATFADLLDVPQALAARRALRGHRVAIVTSTGGAATLVADACGLAGVDAPQPDAATAARLTALDIKDATLDRNPIDVTLAGLRPDLFKSVLDTLIASESYDAIVMIVGSSGIARPDLVAKPVLEALPGSSKPILVYVSPEAPNIIKHLNRQGVPAYSAPEACAAALAAMRRMSQPRAGTAAPAPAALPQVADLRAGPLNEAESKAVFARFGIPVVKEFAAATAADAAAAAPKLGGGPVALKILSREVVHKTEIGGVLLNVAPADVEQRCAELQRAASPSGFKLEGFLVQEMIRGGIEMILGFHRDPQVGPAVLLGHGGITAEVFGDTAVRLLPLEERDARAMIDEIKSGELLKGFRGRPLADVDALVAAILAFARMADALGDRLIEAEINPLIVRPAGDGVRAVDGLILLR